VLWSRHFDEWGRLYLETDPQSRLRSPASVKIPSGPTQDIIDAFAGRLAYDPVAITAPAVIIRGAWDSLVTDANARWLFDALENAHIKRDVKINRATHLMHLESSRFALTARPKPSSTQATSLLLRRGGRLRRRSIW
jgi:pimeloyl-ACP methyl ester carboxylesterase